ncbi:hypothetical protein GSF08_00505 [Clostridiaceae bacterium DONG20-135]|uniref:Uncharacterized protein n=1 Tax=Copranaerobaculum intestinale TaxID=2692629 RepID=A0A6N8U3D9_9FIRM|nr:hypothetical protein [Copranaerobaculum intestinale]MXQ72421.1 hypothetical protein [Copranaerobaculum intestinale]
MIKAMRISLTCFIIGIGCFAVAAADVISIGAGIVNTLFHTSLPDVFFSSLLFRTGILIVGAIFLLIGGILYKKLEPEAKDSEHNNHTDEAR